MSAYSEKLRDPRWQKKRLEIMSRDDFKCVVCEHDEITLNVHHTFYRKGADPWDYPNSSLVTLCERCHSDEHEYRSAQIKRLNELLGTLGVSWETIGTLVNVIQSLPAPTARSLDALVGKIANVEELSRCVDGFDAELDGLINSGWERYVSSPSQEGAV